MAEIDISLGSGNEKLLNKDQIRKVVGISNKAEDLKSMTINGDSETQNNSHGSFNI